MNEAFQKQITDLTEKLNTHIISRHDNDKHIAVSLQRIEDTMRSVDEQVKKTNGRVTLHDAQFVEIIPKMNILYAAYTQEVADKKSTKGKIAEWGWRLAILVIGMILTKLNIINFNLPI